MPPESDFQKEIDQLEQRFAENPHGLVFAHLADAYRKAGEYAKAEGLILHGLKNHPSYISAYNVLGRVYLDSERFSDAHEQFSRVIQLDPHNLIALKALGDLAARGGRPDDARTWYERILQVDPRNDEAREALRGLDAPADDLPPSEAFQPVAQAGPPGPEEEPASPGDDVGPPWDFEDMIQLEKDSDAAEPMAEPPQELKQQATDETENVVAGLPDSADLLPWDAVPDLEELEAGGQQEAEVEGTPDKDELSEPALGAQPLPDAAADDTWNLDFGALDEWAPSFLGDEAAAGTESAAPESKPETLDVGEADLGLPDISEPSAAPAAGEKRPGEGVVTETMARLYADQGLYEDALAIYRQLSELRPGDEGIQARIAEIEARLAVTSEMVAGDAESRETERADRFDPGELAEADTPVSSAATAPEAAAGSQDENPFEFEDEAPVAGFDLLDPFAASFDVLVRRDVVAASPRPAEEAEKREAEIAEPAEPPKTVSAEVAPAEVEAAPEEELAAAGSGTDQDDEAILGIGSLAPEADLAPAAELTEEAETEAPWEWGALSVEREPEAEEPVAVEPAPGEPAAVAEPEGAVDDADILADTLVTASIADEGAGVSDFGEAEEAGVPTVEDYLNDLLAFTPGSRELKREGAAEEAGPQEGSDSDEARDLEEFQAWLRSLKR